MQVWMWHLPVMMVLEVELVSGGNLDSCMLYTFFWWDCSGGGGWWWGIVDHDNWFSNQVLIVVVRISIKGNYLKACQHYWLIQTPTFIHNVSPFTFTYTMDIDMEDYLMVADTDQELTHSTSDQSLHSDKSHRVTNGYEVCVHTCVEGGCISLKRARYCGVRRTRSSQACEQ